MLKHIGRVRATGKKCIVAFRTLPGESDCCLVVLTEGLSSEYHDTMIKLVESVVGQDSYEFAEVMSRNVFPDGTNILASLHSKGRLLKMATDAIEMLPDHQTSILLSELNQLIAEQRGVPVDELAVKDPKEEFKPVKPKADLTVEQIDLSKPKVQVEPDYSKLSPEDQLVIYRSKAEEFAKKAAEFQRLADAIAKPQVDANIAPEIKVEPEVKVEAPVESVKIVETAEIKAEPKSTTVIETVAEIKPVQTQAKAQSKEQRAKKVMEMAKMAKTSAED